MSLTLSIQHWWCMTSLNSFSNFSEIINFPSIEPEASEYVSTRRCRRWCEIFYDHLPTLSANRTPTHESQPTPTWIFRSWCCIIQPSPFFFLFLLFQPIRDSAKIFYQPSQSQFACSSLLIVLEQSLMAILTFFKSAACSLWRHSHFLHFAFPLQGFE